MKKLIVKMINKLLSPFNIQLIKVTSTTSKNFTDIFVPDDTKNKIISLDNLSVLSRNIKGMISARAGEELFSIAYMQNLRGNVVEIGSFQGKSTFFLGSAVKLSKNGKMFAIDHFKGNKGKEKFYVVNEPDLSDLENGFKKNIKLANLQDTVELINKPNNVAADQIEDNSIRLLYIDGDHTEEGVKSDLALFEKKLKNKAIIIFDDYDSVNFYGLVKVVNNFIGSQKVKRKYLIGRTLILELDNQT